MSIWLCVRNQYTVANKLRSVSTGLRRSSKIIISHYHVKIKEFYETCRTSWRRGKFWFQTPLLFITHIRNSTIVTFFFLISLDPAMLWSSQVAKHHYLQYKTTYILILYRIDCDLKNRVFEYSVIGKPVYSVQLNIFVLKLLGG